MLGVMICIKAYTSFLVKFSFPFLNFVFLEDVCFVYGFCTQFGIQIKEVGVIVIAKKRFLYEVAVFPMVRNESVF